MRGSWVRVPPPASGADELLDEIRRARPAVGVLDPCRDRVETAPERAVGQQPVDRAAQLLRLPLVAREPLAEAELVDSLRVVVLVPEERKYDHRLPEVQALGDGVV